MSAKVKLRPPLGRRAMTVLVVAAIVILCICSRAILSEFGEGDMSLRTLEPCEPPCWQGIVPGQSTTKDVERILGALPFIKAGTVKRQSIPGPSGTYFSWGTKGVISQWGAIWLENDRVTKIRTTPGFQLTLGEAVERLGPPTFVYPNRVTAADARYYVVVAYYPQRGFSLHSVQLDYALGPGATYTVEPGFNIEWALYFAPTGLDDIIDTLESPYDPEMAASILKRTYPWYGFGTFAATEGVPR